MTLTEKQAMIMGVIVLGNTDKIGRRLSWCDYSQTIERLPYKVARQSLTCSISFLERKGLVKRNVRGVIRRGHKVTVFVPTEFGLQLMGVDKKSKQISKKNAASQELVLHLDGDFKEESFDWEGLN